MTDKIQPNCQDIEEAVIGALLLEKDAYQVVSPILKAEMFYAPKNGLIYEAVVYLIERGDPVDILTVSQFLRSKGNLAGAGGPLYISQLTNRVASSVNIGSHADIIYGNWAKRELIALGRKLEQRGFDEGEHPKDSMEFAKSEVERIEGAVSKITANHVSEYASMLTDMIIARNGSKDGLSGVPYGIRELDVVFAGAQRSDLIYVAAKPGQGKTSLALSIVLEQAKLGIPTAFFSMEMSPPQLVGRLISQESGINNGVISKHPLNFSQMQTYYIVEDVIKKLPIYIDGTPALSIFDFKLKAKMLVEKKGVQMIFVDYGQLMTVGKETKRSNNRQEELDTISRNLKATAKELNIPIFVLLQLKRENDKKYEGNEPMLSDLKGTAAFEADADVIAFIHRPEHYGQEVDADGNPTKGLAKFIIAKHRNGPLLTVNLRFISNLTKFTGGWGNSFMTEVEVPHPDSRLTPNTSFESSSGEDVF